MAYIAIPIPSGNGEQEVEIEVTINGPKQELRYRVELFLLGRLRSTYHRQGCMSQSHAKRLS